MGSSDIAYIGSIIVLVLISALFSGSEIALLTVNRVKLNNLIEEGSERAKNILRLVEKPNRLITGILVGNNIVNILATSLATSYATKLLPNNMAVVVSTVILTIVIVIFAEMFPKTASNANSLKVSILVYYPILVSLFLFRPLIWLFDKTNTLLLKIFRIGNSENVSLAMNHKELETVINLSKKEGLIHQNEQEMLKSVFEFSDTHVSEIMVPRVDMVCLDVEDGIEEFLRLVKETGISRIPVYEEKPDNIIGVLFVKDVVRWIANHKTVQDVNIKSNLRPVDFVPESKMIDQLFNEMRAKKSHIVMVVDEYGGISGLATLEDILEEIVGEIQDEFDSEEELSKQLKDGTYEILGDYPMDDFNDNFHTCIHEEDIDTISGFMLAKLGHIPSIGEKVVQDHLELVVRAMEDRRIIKVSVKITEEDDVKSSKLEKDAGNE
ncbi:MAG: hemolysin family protein [Caldisericia bacterium]|nr:hemolysin family protein [Caldisericia bacterium]MDD4613964.1 hemolysin family protein [Caldisericia bacterium]